MNMKQLLPGVLLTCACIMGGMSFISALSNNYSVTADLSAFNGTVSRFDSTVDRISDIKNITTSIEFKSVADTFIYAPYEMVRVGYNVVLLIMDGLSIPATIAMITIIIAIIASVGVCAATSDNPVAADCVAHHSNERLPTKFAVELTQPLADTFQVPVLHASIDVPNFPSVTKPLPTTIAEIANTKNIIGITFNPSIVILVFWNY